MQTFEPYEKVVCRFYWPSDAMLLDDLKMLFNGKGLNSSFAWMLYPYLKRLEFDSSVPLSLFKIAECHGTVVRCERGTKRLVYNEKKKLEVVCIMSGRAKYDRMCEHLPHGGCSGKYYRFTYTVGGKRQELSVASVPPYWNLIYTDEVTTWTYTTTGHALVDWFRRWLRVQATGGDIKQCGRRPTAIVQPPEAKSNATKKLRLI